MSAIPLPMNPLLLPGRLLQPMPTPTSTMRIPLQRPTRPCMLPNHKSSKPILPTTTTGPQFTLWPLPRHPLQPPPSPSLPLDPAHRIPHQFNMALSANSSAPPPATAPSINADNRPPSMDLPKCSDTNIPFQVPHGTAPTAWTRCRSPPNLPFPPTVPQYHLDQACPHRQLPPPILTVQHAPATSHLNPTIALPHLPLSKRSLNIPEPGLSVSQVANRLSSMHRNCPAYHPCSDPTSNPLPPYSHRSHPLCPPPCWT